MLQSHHRYFLRGVQALDLLIVGSSVCIGASIPILAPAEAAPAAAVLQQAVVICLAWFLIAYRTGLYQHSRRTESIGREMRQLLEVNLMGVATGVLLVSVAWRSLGFNPLMTFVAAAAGLSAQRIVLRTTLHKIRDLGWNYRNTVLVGRGGAGSVLAREVARNPKFGIRLVGSFYLPGESHGSPDGVPCLGPADAFTRFILHEDVDSVVLCPSPKVTSSEVNSVLEKCDEAGVRCLYAPDFLALKNLTSSTTWICDVPAFTFHANIGSPIQLALKRVMDIVGASIGILLCMPLFVAIAAAIRISSGGPILFRQVRLGKDGKRFHCYKFRSMHTDAEQRKAALQDQNESDGPAFKIRRDPRITAVGRVLRKYSLDELPQLFNVVKGDMSLVGPRPPVPDEVNRYLWWQRRRISVRPGLTCVWQVQGRNSVSFDDWMKMDLYYIDNWSLWMDIKLMLRTMPAVVRGTGV